MKKFLAIFLTSIILLSQAFIIIAGATPKTEANQEKLTDELKAEMETKKNNEYISIYIWLYEIDDSYVYNVLSEHYDFELNLNNEGLFLDKRVNENVEKYYSYLDNREITNDKNYTFLQQEEKHTVLQEQLFNIIRDNSIVNETISDDVLKKFIEAERDITELIAQSEQNAYIKEWRKTRKSINYSINNSFEKSIDYTKCKNVYVDSMLGFVTMECQKSYIDTISSSLLVEKIGLEKEEDAALVDLIDETTVESETTPLGYHMFQSKLPEGSNGAGINIGVMEFSNEDDESYLVYYDNNNPHLIDKGANIVTRVDPLMEIDKISETPNGHATTVLAILCGDPIQSTDGIYYQGIAPSAKIYYTNVLTNSEGNLSNIIAGFDWLINTKNVSAINISAGNGKKTGYNQFSVYVDCLVQCYRVSIIVAAGNNGSAVYRPGVAYNAITVGYETSERTENGGYIINQNSSYLDVQKNANKPDIVAFGTNIYMLNVNGVPTCNYLNNGRNEIVSGSSFSTPMVTGTIALMMQVNSNLIGNPHKVKSILLTSADDENVDITDINNYTRCSVASYDANYLSSATPIIRNKTGAGVLNIKASVENAKSSITYSYEFTTNGSKTTNEIYIPSNMKFKIGLVFEKSDHDLITSNSPYLTNVNFEMIDVNTGNVVFSSTASENNSKSRYDNVKIFDIETNITGTYVLKITCSNIDNTDQSTPQSPMNHTTLHDKINVSLSITCSCLNPIRGSNTDMFNDESTVRVNYCNSYGCFHVILTDITYYDELSWSEPFGTITYNVTHKRSYSNEIIITDDKFEYDISLNNPNYTYQVRYTHGNIQNVSYGYIDQYYFEIYVYDNMGKMTMYESAIEVEYVDLIDRIYLYPLSP